MDKLIKWKNDNNKSYNYCLVGGDIANCDNTVYDEEHQKDMLQQTCNILHCFKN